MRSTQRLQLGLAAARDRDLGAEPLPRVAQRRVDLRVGRVQLGGELVLDQRLFETLRRGEPAAGEEVLLGGPEPGALQGAARVAVVRVGRTAAVYSTTARS